MQALPPDPPPAEIRRPWPDELTRLDHFLPPVTTGATGGGARVESALVAVRGRVERLVGAAVLSPNAARDGVQTRRLRLRIDEVPERRLALAKTLLKGALEIAWAAGTERVVFTGMLDEGSELAAVLRGLGFREASVRDIYGLPARPLLERLERIHTRLRASGAIPGGVEVTTLQPEVFAAARAFIHRHLPGHDAAMAMESSAFRPEHSLALWRDGELAGVLLVGRTGRTAIVTLRLVAPELRGGLAWANVLLLYTGIRSAVDTGLETLSFEVNPELHEDTRQFAQAQGVRPERRMVMLAVTRKNA